MQYRSIVFPRHLDLLDLPTPVEPLPGVRNVWIKRDDLTGKPYGGNKPRKLEFLLADALDKNAKTIVTTGATGSNHCLATTVYARSLGLNVHLIMFPQPETDVVRHHFNAVQALGAEVTLGASYDEFEVLKAKILTTVPDPYFISAGGSNRLGCLGYVRAAMELSDQIDAGRLPVPETVICAAGTLGTMAGLALGFYIAGRTIALQGIQVVDPIVTNRENLNALIRDASELLAMLNVDFHPPEPRNLPIEIITDYFGPGYGESTAKSSAAEQWMASHGPVRADPTYTAKTLAAVLDGCRTEKQPVKPMVYWHTFDPGYNLKLS